MISLPISQNRRDCFHSLHQHVCSGYLRKRIYVSADGSMIIYALNSDMDSADCPDPQLEKIRTGLSYRFRRIWIVIYHPVCGQIHYDHSPPWSATSILHAYPAANHRASCDSRRSLFLPSSETQ
jgi:hypothetical protein